MHWSLRVCCVMAGCSPSWCACCAVALSSVRRIVFCLPLTDMLTQVLNRLTRSVLGWIVVILAVLVAGVLVRSAWFKTALEDARVTIERLEADTTRLRTEMRQMQAAVRTQNDSLRALQAQARALNARMERALREGRRLRRATEREAGRILSTVVADTSCHAAIRQAALYADTLSTRWH